ncbi:hypothetical protein KEM52_002542, partial [Ascosphaera acerosa]
LVQALTTIDWNFLYDSLKSSLLSMEQPLTKGLNHLGKALPFYEVKIGLPGDGSLTVRALLNTRASTEIIGPRVAGRFQILS